MTNTKVQRIPNPKVTSASTAPAAKMEEIEVPKESGFISLDDSKVEINWIHTAMLVVVPLIGGYGMLTTPLTLPTFVWTLIMYFWTGLGITGGYHRLWSHRAYKATWIVRLLLIIGGGAAMEGSAKWWCRNHRAHHRYTDTEKDPYNAKNGFFYSHLGWMLYKQKAKNIGYADISDLNRDPMVLWQHKYYPLIGITAGIIFPTLVAGLWGDFRGGYFYAAFVRIFVVHHATFFVNSLAHHLGEKTYSDLHTSYDSFVTAVLTLGEGYHNYHHEFPEDYRNGIEIYHYDPTKWLIKGLSIFGLTYGLKEISLPEIEKAKIQMQQRNVNFQKAKVNFGKNFNQLPEMNWSEIKKRVSLGDQLVVISGLIHDVSSFVHDHPGGRRTLENVVGTDATEMFEGKNEKFYKHSKEARKFLLSMRIAKLSSA